MEHNDHDGKFPSLGTMHTGGVAQGQCRKFFAHKRHFVTASLYDGDMLLWHGTDQRASVPVEDIEAVVVFGHNHAIADAKLVLWEELYTLSIRIKALLQGTVERLCPNGTDIEGCQDLDIGAWINC